jgi:hypothetical protein
MNGPQTVIVDNVGGDRPFTFDYSFWSHDGFEVNEDGLAIKKNPQYAD